MSQDEKIKSKLHQQLTIFETVSTKSNDAIDTWWVDWKDEI